ncbi:hypothetical protein [Methyloversatilis sp. NSM2]|uniref:hypothetical protein n=1 Tax=Methyloversatilis sp. NSM2 TaxID=3134135 RepID=UPI003113F015
MRVVTGGGSGSSVLIAGAAGPLFGAGVERLGNHSGFNVATTKSTARAAVTD